jgi:hypothetical protein
MPVEPMTFLGQLGPTLKAEKTRLQSEYDRALGVVAEIDAAGGTGVTHAHQ